MRLSISLLLALSVGLRVVEGTKWAVLVAGSQGYTNYRHQADVHHSYHVVSEMGVKDENIIMMHFDDIAKNSENPFPGKVFNAPTEAGTPGADVYAGIKSDYTGRDVTPKNFLAVLKGDSATATGPVLGSTADDEVFIFFADHGGTGILAFPEEYMYQKELNKALKEAKKLGMWKHAVFYVEACEAGSIFDGLTHPSTDVYVVTASNTKESSYGTFCPPDDMVNGEDMDTCLGDLFSVDWMSDSTAANGTETLEDQYTSVKKATNLSHVSQYGDLSFTDQRIRKYEGMFRDATAKVRARAARVPEMSAEMKERARRSAVPAYDVPLHLKYYSHLRTDKTDYLARQASSSALLTMLQSQMAADQLFHDWTLAVTASEDKAQDFLHVPVSSAQIVLCGACCRTLYQTIADSCGGFDDYSFKYTRVAHHLCSEVAELGGSASDAATSKLQAALLQHCE